MKVWVVTGVEDDGTDSGYQYISCVFDSAEKANTYAENGWGLNVEEFDVQ